MRVLCLTLCLFLCNGFWDGFAHAEGQSCFYCGMYRAKFEHSWVIITHEDGSREGVCSIHCAAIDMALHTDKSVRKITVGDFDTKKQIDADGAHWVIGGDIMGVMTVRAKWAFEDMYQDTLMIRKHRKLIQMRKNQSQ